MIHTSTNPICVLTRPDGELSSVYHSFFLLKAGVDCPLQVLWRVPERRARLDDVEAGLGIFVNDIFALNLSASDMFGSFVITTSDGSRFFAYWRGAGDLIFVGVSFDRIVLFQVSFFSLLFLLFNRFLSLPLDLFLGSYSVCYNQNSVVIFLRFY